MWLGNTSSSLYFKSGVTHFCVPSHSQNFGVRSNKSCHRPCGRQGIKFRVVQQPAEGFLHSEQLRWVSAQRTVKHLSSPISRLLRLCTREALWSEACLRSPGPTFFSDVFCNQNLSVENSSVTTSAQIMVICYAV